MRSLRGASARLADARPCRDLYLEIAKLWLRYKLQKRSRRRVSRFANLCKRVCRRFWTLSATVVVIVRYRPVLDVWCVGDETELQGPRLAMARWAGQRNRPESDRGRVPHPVEAPKRP